VTARRSDKAVDDAFDPATLSQFGQKYLELVYANWFETVRTLRRTVLLCIAAVLSFLLLDNSSGELNLGLIKTSDASAASTLLPAVTSFLLFEAIDLTVASFYYQDITAALMRKLYPSIYRNDLELLLAPPASFAWGAGTAESLSPPPQGTGKLDGVREWTGGLLVAAVILGVIGFLVYAYLSLYGSDQTNFFVVTASLAFTLFNVLRGGIQIADSWQEIGSHG
jgi:hypothetical protein